MIYLFKAQKKCYQKRKLTSYAVSKMIIKQKLNLLSNMKDDNPNNSYLLEAYKRWHFKPKLFLMQMKAANPNGR